MFGLDHAIAHLSDGATVAVVIAVAIVLGLRHATDPDHLAAVTTLVAGGKERTRRLAAQLGFAWGAGHATSLFVLGLPLVLFSASLPASAQEAAETATGAMIVALAIWLLIRWRRGVFHAHEHEHGPSEQPHGHVHSHARSPLQAYGIGLVHGIGGSAGVGVLLLATIQSHAVAVVALVLFALFTAVSMALLSTGFGLTLSSRRARRSFHRIAPAMGFASLLFGVWYALGALQLAPYVF